MKPPDRFVGPARMTVLAAVIHFVEAFCARERVAHADMLRLSLLVEELVSNTVRHGHGGDCDEPIALALQRHTDGVVLEYEDQAPPFDPLAAGRAAAAALDARVDILQVGGRGLPLIAELPHESRYERRGNRNHLMLRLLTR